MKKYEAVIILDDQQIDDSGDALVKQVQSVIEELGGTVSEVESMGQRQLAYSINKRNTATYWDLVFELPEAKVADLKERYRLNETVLRLEVFVFDRPDVICGKVEEEEEAEADA